MHIPAYVRQAVIEAGWRHRSAFQCDVQYFEPYVYYTSARNFAVQINDFMSLTIYFDVKYRY